MTPSGVVKPRVRALRPDDIEAFADLCATRDELDRAAAEARAALVAHIAFANPADDGNPTYFVIEQGDRLMGHLGRMPTVFVIDGQRVRASYMHDLYVHPELRAGGRAFFLSMKMYRECEKASPSFCALVWTNEINIKLQTVRKYRQMWTERYVKPVRADGRIDRMVPVAAARAVGKPAAALALRIADHALALVARRRAGLALLGRPRIEEIAGFDDRFDRLAERLQPVVGIGPVKDGAYLRWKYADRPRFSHATYAAIGAGGELDGFAVVHVPDSEHHESYLLELCADPEDDATLIALLARAVEHCRSAGAYVVQAVATDPRIQRVLRGLRFAPRGAREPVFLANADRFENPAALHQLERWQFSMGDSEGPV